MTVPKTLGQRIAQARRELSVRLYRDVTKAELGRVAGVTAAAVSLWEADKRPPREDALTKLAAFLGVTKQYLRYGVRDTLTIAGLEIDVATITPVSEAELASLRRALEIVEARTATPPPTRRAGNSRRKK